MFYSCFSLLDVLVLYYEYFRKNKKQSTEEKNPWRAVFLCPKGDEHMSLMTKERAKTHLNAWYEADMAVSTGQSYKIGSRELRRADLKEIREQIKYLENKVRQLEIGKQKRSRRIAGIIPRDF